MFISIDANLIIVSQFYIIIFYQSTCYFAIHG